MAVDEELADRVRRRLNGRTTWSERRMFGGLSFLVDGHLALAVRGSGGLLVRVGVAAAPRLAEGPGASEARMGERPMRGWLHVEGAAVEDDATLGRWVDTALGHVASLPPRA